MADLSILRSMPVLLVEAKLLLTGGNGLGFASPDAADAGAATADTPSGPVMSPGSLAGADPGPVPSAQQESFAGKPSPQSAPFLAGLRSPYPQRFGGTAADSAGSAGPGQPPALARAVLGSASLAVVDAEPGWSGEAASFTVTGSAVLLIASKDLIPAIDTRPGAGASPESMLDPPEADGEPTAGATRETPTAPARAGDAAEPDVAPSRSEPDAVAVLEAPALARPSTAQALAPSLSEVPVAPSAGPSADQGTSVTNRDGPVSESTSASVSPLPSLAALEGNAQPDAAPDPLAASAARSDGPALGEPGTEAPFAPPGADLALPADAQMPADAPRPNPDGTKALTVAGQNPVTSEPSLVARSPQDQKHRLSEGAEGHSALGAPREDERDRLARLQGTDKLSLHDAALLADVTVGRRNPTDNIDVWSRDILGQLASGDAQVATGIIPSFILNAAMIPGWPPPRPFEMPTPGQLTRLLANDPQNEAALLKALTERGGASLVARLRKFLKRLTRSRRLQMLLGLTALMSTIEATIEAIEAELLEFSRLHAAQDDLAFETALQRRHLSA